MNANANDKSGAPKKPGAGRNTSARQTTRSSAKKPATIDLKAEELIQDTDEKAAKESTSSSDKTKPVTKTSSSASTTPKVEKPSPTKPDDGIKSDKLKKSGSGFGSMAAAGIVGGIVTLAGAGGLQYAGMLPAMNGTTETTNVDNVAAVDLEPLQSEVSKLQARVEELAKISSNTETVDVKPIEERLAALEAGGPADGNGSIILDEATRSKIEEMDSALSALKTEITDIQSRLSQATISSDGINVGGAALAQLQTRLDTVEQAANPLTEQMGVLKNTLDENSANLTKLSDGFTALSETVNTEVKSRIGAFEEKLQKAATGEKLAKSVAINALKSAVQRGEPFSAALTSLETLQGTSPQLESLKGQSRTGIATDIILLSEFRDLQGNILAASADTPDAGMVDRLMANVRSLVTVRTDAPLSGATPEAIVSRIDAALKGGNLTGAMDEWNTLPQAAKTISAEWQSKVANRIETDRQLKTLLDGMNAEG